MTVSERIARSGLSDKALAEMVGVNLTTVWRWRRRDLRPEEPEHVAGLAKALGCHPRDIRPDQAAIYEG